MSQSEKTKVCPKRAATAFRTATAAAVTSGPMPSPGQDRDARALSHPQPGSCASPGAGRTPFREQEAGIAAAEADPSSGRENRP